VDDDDLLRALALFEEVIEPLTLHPALQKRELALAILHHQLLAGVIRVEPQLEVGTPEAGVGEHGLDDRGDRLLREHATVAREPELPEPRHEEQPVERPARRLLKQAHVAEDAVKPLGLLLVALELQRRLARDHLAEITGARGPFELDEDLELVGP